MGDTLQVLQKTFPTISLKDLGSLAQTARHSSYPPQTILCRQGERGHTLYVLTEGEMDILVTAEGDQEVYVDTIRAGQYMGEMALFGDAVRMATVKTRTACKTVEIDHEHFFQIVQDNPSMLQAMISLIIGHLRSNDRALIQDLNLKNQALQSAYGELAEQEEFRAQFIATLAHELRTPLTSLRGFISLITQGAFQGDSLQVAMGSINRNVDKLVSLTNSLLVLYEMSPKAPEFDYLNVMDLMVSALDALKESETVDLKRLSLNMTADLPQMNLDKKGLVLAIRALVENAFKFTVTDAPIAVTVFCTPEQEVAIQIQDQGVGIPEEQTERIFEPFYRLEVEGNNHLFAGIGVGLTIAKIMVERHDGRIAVASKVGEGSTFCILLPMKK